MSKTVLITGASSGICLETAKIFSSQGWNVVATMRNPLVIGTSVPNILYLPLEQGRALRGMNHIIR